MEGLGLGCDWLAGLVWDGLGCVIVAAGSNNGGGRVLGLCVWNGIQRCCTS